MKYTEVRLNSLCGAIASIGMATSTQNNRPRSLPASSAVRATRVRVPNRISAHEIEVANPTSQHATDIKRPWRSLATSELNNQVKIRLQATIPRQRHLIELSL